MSAFVPELFAGYFLVGKIATGGSGDLFFARPPRALGMPPIVALKRLREDGWTDEDAQRRFRHEAEVWTRLDSPYLARIFDVGAVGPVPYFVSEYLEGWTLAEVISALARERKYPSIGWVSSVWLDVLEALAAIHGLTGPEGPLELVHRDVNPKNVIIGLDLRARLIDLGLGRSAGRDWKTRTGAVMGTPGYLSPEQARGAAVDARCDLYSATVVTYELLTLTPFIRRGPLPEMLAAAVSPSLVSPRSRRSDLSVNAEKVILRALEAKAEDRYSSARALASAVRAAWPPSQADVGLSSHLLTVSPRPDLGELLALPDPPPSEELAEATVVFSRVSPAPSKVQRPARSTTRVAGAVIATLAGIAGVVAAYGLNDGSVTAPAPVAPVAVPGVDVGRAPAVRSPPPPATRPATKSNPSVRPRASRALDAEAARPQLPRLDGGLAPSAPGQAAVPRPEPSRPGPTVEDTDALRARALELLRRLDRLSKSERSEATAFELLAQRRTPRAEIIDRLAREVEALERVGDRR